MGMYVVRRAWVIEADSAEDAAAKVSGPPTFTRVAECLPTPSGVQRWYTQPLAVLDNAWDAFHEREMGDPPFADEPDPFPKFVDASLQGLNPQQLSMIMDVAITSYREAHPQ